MNNDLEHVKEQDIDTRIDRKHHGDKSNSAELSREVMKYGPLLVSFSNIKTQKSLTLNLSTIAKDTDNKALTFVLPLSGELIANVSGSTPFSITKNSGLLVDCSNLPTELVALPGTAIKLYICTLELETLVELFTHEGCEVDLKLLLSSSNHPHAMLRCFPISTLIKQLAVATFHNKQLSRPLQRLYLEGACSQLFALILGQQSSKPLLAKAITGDLLTHKSTLHEAAQYLLKDVANPPSIEQLAKQSGLSPRRLNLEFKEIFGCSVFGLLCQRRLQLAKEALIETPQIALNELALRIGYAHSTNFIAAFKREFGIPPRQYAKLHQR
ncbi:MAG: AraC-like DNA-binding protein [Paraglaciecola psychrophila]|jgi:AraC-like DNA-binding protein